LSALSGNAFENDDQFFAWLNESLPPPVAPIAEFYVKHVGDDVNFEVCDEFAGIKGRVSGKGLSELHKAIMQGGLKFLPF